MTDKEKTCGTCKHGFIKTPYIQDDGKDLGITLVQPCAINKPGHYMRHKGSPACEDWEAKEGDCEDE